MLLDVDALFKLPDDQFYEAVRGWTAAEAEMHVNAVKAAVDAHWWQEPTRSVQYAEMIIKIGQIREEIHHVALGTMALGDSLRMLGHVEQAWQALETAGRLYQEAGDAVGWARTRIGRLPISVDLRCTAQTLEEAERAREIFREHGDYERLLRLELNAGTVYNWLGDYVRGVGVYQAAIQIAENLGERDSARLAGLYNNLGYAYNFLGDLDAALAYYQRGYAYFLQGDASSGMVLLELNIAYIDYLRGYYRRALYLLYRVLHKASTHPLNKGLAEQVMVQCYLRLNRFQDARNLAEQAANEQRKAGAFYEMARTLGHLGTAEMELGHYGAAGAAFDEAEAIFASIQAVPLVANVQLLRGRLALKQGDLNAALAEARAAKACFVQADQQINHAMALLLETQALLAANEIAAAQATGMQLLHLAKRTAIMPLRYNAHLLLGRANEATAHATNAKRALRHYSAAAALLQRVQQELTITLRADFLEDKGEAFRALMRLHLKSGDTHTAFQTLEREKSHMLLHYLAQRAYLRWSSDDEYGASLLQELDLRRAEHHWLYQQAQHNGGSPDAEVLEKLAQHEAQMRKITEQLYLNRPREETTNLQTSSPTLEEIQQHLQHNRVMLAYYDDGEMIWVFVITSQTLEVHPLNTPRATIAAWQEKFEKNVDRALLNVPESPVANSLADKAKIILNHLYSLLIAPVAARIAPDAQLLIVPYGLLHYVPFHLLYTGSAYLIEQHEVVILPAAALITRLSARQPAGGLVLSHSWDGRLPHTWTEAQMVSALCHGDLYDEDDARRSVLQSAPRQILHIAAHGEQRPDQPEFSFIELANGQLYMDDLLQHDLGYEIVVLSACETGRSHVLAGEEVIGLGRGFLLAGAGALVTSLWRINDLLTVEFMRVFYQALMAGKRKSTALQAAMVALLGETKTLHPAFWGAFQLIGDTKPLSGIIKR